MGWGKTSVSETAVAGSDLQKALKRARVVYASATAATEIHNLGYCDRLGLWGRDTAFADKTDFITKIGSGGVAAMELVAQGMKQQGVYIARALSFVGVEYDRLEHVLDPDQREVYNKLTEAWQLVLNNFEAALELTASYRDKEGNKKIDKKAKMRAIGQFWGGHQRFFNAVICAMKMPTVIRSVREQLAAGNSAVIQLVNTNEAAQERQLAKMTPEDSLEDLDLTPRDQICQLVEHCFPVHQHETYEDDNGNVCSRIAKDKAGNFIINREAVAMRDELLGQVASVRVPKGPLDMIIDAFGEDGVAEITGRTRRVVKVEVEGEMRNAIQSRSQVKCLADAKAFQEGRKRVLVFSDAGGTGASYHADRNVKNQAKRIHYLVQAGWVADVAIQGFGRTHRSNQCQPPMYYLCCTDLAGEKRFISSIARRLDQLGALTKGQRQTGSNGIFKAADNLESQYARDALVKFFEDLQSRKIDTVSINDFEAQTGLKLRTEDGYLKRDDLPPITRFLNRLLSLTIETQNLVFAAYAERLDAAIQTAMDNGTLDVGLETLRADRIRKVRETVVYTHAASGAETKHVELRLGTRNKPATWDEVTTGSHRVHRKKVEFFAVNKRSGHFYAFVDGGDWHKADGSHRPSFRQIGPATDERIEMYDARDPSKFRRVDDLVQAQALWEEAIRNVPEFREWTVHLITGAVLPIWDRLSGQPKVFRLKTDEGEKMLGRMVPEMKIEETLRRLGVGGTGKADWSAEKVVEHLESNDRWRFELSNGWVIKKSTVSGEVRYELDGPDYRQRATLLEDGLISETIQWTPRWFIPTKHDKAVVMIAKIIRSKPVVEAKKA